NMRRNVLATELHLPIVLSAIVGIPILEAWLWLGWSREVLGVIEIGIVLVAYFAGRPVQAWLSPRMGIPPPREIGGRRKA
ncbi:MAG TPA: hypothetical protein VG816_03860, partial [Solirubrobacterales bacterium]|nr:hypothetical protein [Solirubrobacterales bacterium]